MGDMVDLMLVGVVCQYCGEMVDGEETGFPRPCEGCEDD